MRKIFAVILAAALVPSGLMVAAAHKKKSSSKKTSSTAKKSTAKKSTASTKKKTAPKKKSSSKKSRKKTTAKSGQTWRSRQLQPVPDRYREIQQALIDKGHLKGPATGKWDQESADALRHFQQEQNLEPSGKINSLSLIALGLGPKYDTAAVAAAPPPVP